MDNLKMKTKIGLALIDTFLNNLKMKTKIGIGVVAGILVASGLHLRVSQDVHDYSYSQSMILIMTTLSVLAGLWTFIGVQMLCNPKDIKHYIASLAALISIGYLTAFAYYFLSAAFVSEFSEELKQGNGLIVMTVLFFSYLVFCFYKIRKLAFLD